MSDQINFTSADYPWPEKNDKLFESGDDWWHNACLNYMRDSTELYIRGYKEAADALVTSPQTTRGYQDFFIFPVAFLYRQYLELRLKDLINTGNQLFHDQSNHLKTHDLLQLWKTCKPLLILLEPKIEQEDIDAAEEAINQFYRVDPTSQAFRYPFLRDGQPAIPPDIRYINLRNLAEIMEKVSNFLDAGAQMMAVYLEYKQDMALEFKNATDF